MLVSKKNIVLAFTLLSLISSSCKKDEEPVETNATLKMIVDTKMNGEDLVFNKNYITPGNDTIQVTELKYFVTNVELVDTIENTTIKFPDSYFLINAINSRNIKVANTNQIGSFQKIRMSIGVDSISNHTIDQFAGDLDPLGSDGMIWRWSTGYKFIRFEGRYSSSDTSDADFIQHVGGDKLYTVLEFPLSKTIEVKDGSEKVVHMYANLENLLSGPKIIDFDNLHVGHDPLAKHPMAENWENGFLNLDHAD